MTTVTLEFVGTATDWLAATRAHWQSLGLDEAPLDVLAPQLDLQQGAQRYGEYRGTPRLFVVEALLDGGQPCVDCIVSGDDAELWASRLSAPLASASTIEVQATRGTLTVPVVGGVGQIKPKSPRFCGLSGIGKPPVAPEAPDAPEVEAWQQRQPGIANGYMWGEMAADEGKVWVQALDLPETAPGALNGGSYARPSAPASGWITTFVDTEPIWAAGYVYVQPRVVRWPNNGAGGPLHRYRLLTASEAAIVGREPHHAYMWGVWEDLGAV